MAGLSINKRRFIYNTHENAERPYYISILLKTCSKPRESVLITNLAALVHRKLRRKMGFPIPERAAPYIIQTAIELGILERDVYKEGFVNRWGARGYVINAIAPNDIPLGLPGDLKLLEKDRLAFLKYYLDANGIALMYFARRLHLEGEIVLSEFVKGKEVEVMWNNIIKDSISHTRNDKLRSEMQELLRKSRFLSGNPRAKGKTLEHIRKQKVTPHLDLLVDLGIVERSPPKLGWQEVAKYLEMKDKGLKKTTTSTQERVIYRPKQEGSINRISTFLDITDSSKLDGILSPQEGRYFATAAELYGIKYPRIDTEEDFGLMQKEVVRVYETIRDDVYRLAFIDSIKDIVCINLQADKNRICEPQDVWTTIEAMHRLSEKDVRYHRDNCGVVTYMALNDSYVRNILPS